MRMEGEDSVLFSLRGKVAVVTGGGSGIGLAIVRRFAEAGAFVAIADITDQSALAAEIGGIFVQTDVADDAAVARLMSSTLTSAGGLDIVVNNAGIALDDRDDDVTAVDDAVYRRLFEVNALGAAHGVKHGAATMLGAGSIVNVASLAGVIGFPGFPAYSMSKSAVVGLTRSAAMQLAPAIRVNAVCPGFVDTPMADGDAFDYGVFSEAAVPMTRIGSPDDIAAAVHFLASDDAGFVTGQVLNVGGGLSAGVSGGMVGLAFGADAV